MTFQEHIQVTREALDLIALDRSGPESMAVLESVVVAVCVAMGELQDSSLTPQRAFQLLAERIPVRLAYIELHSMRAQGHA